MVRRLVRVLVGAAVLSTVELALVLAGPWRGPAQLESFRLLLIVTGIVILIPSGLALLGPVDSTSEIRPMQGNWNLRERRLGSFGTGGTGATLVSSGTRSLWDAGANPALKGSAPGAWSLDGLGIGAILVALGLMLGLM